MGSLQMQGACECGSAVRCRSCSSGRSSRHCGEDQRRRRRGIIRVDSRLDDRGRDVYSSRGQSDREELALDGWWHAWFDEAAEWEHHEPPDPRTPLGEIETHQPTVGWDKIEEGMESIQVPGTWDSSRPGHRGVVWYWRPLVIPDDWGGRSVWLHFGGVRLCTEVYLDDVLVGYELDGLTPFDVDLTDHVRPGNRYQLAVRVTQPGGTRPGERPRPIAWGETQLPPSHEFGGIWGHVSLVSAHVAHVHGLHVSASEDLSVAQVVCRVVNEGTERRAWLMASVEDASGTEVASSAETECLLAGESTADVALEVSIPEPRAWSPEEPYLYVVRVSLRERSGGDQVTRSFGLRHLAFDQDGYRLNGRPLHLRVARSEGWYPENTAAPSARLAEQEVRAAKDLGLNALRFDGHVASEDVLNAADRLGLFVIERLAGTGSQGVEGSEACRNSLMAWLERTRRDRLYRRGREHPCVLWADMPSSLKRARYCVYEGLPCESTGGPGQDRAPEVCPVSETRQGLPSPANLLARYGDRRLPGSDAAFWQGALDHLQRDFERHGMARVFTGVDSLVRATSRAAEESLARAVRDARLDPLCSGVDVGRWSDQPGCWLGVTDTFREPKAAPERLVRATDPLLLCFDALPSVVRAGEQHTVSVWLSNWSRESGSFMLEVRLVGPNGRLAVEEAGWVLLDGSTGQLLCEMPLATGGGGEYVVQARLKSRGQIVCQTRQSVWSIVARGPSLRRLSILGPADAIALTLSRWGVAWEPFRLGNRTEALLITSSEPDGAVANALYAGAVNRVAILLDGTPRRASAARPAWQDLLPATRSAVRLGEPLGAQGLWLVGGRHCILNGVGDPGVWWHTTDQNLYPRYVLRDVPGTSLVSLCYLDSVEASSARYPRIGTVAAVGSLGEAKCLLCGLGVVLGVQREQPLAERVLSNILDWLGGGT